jgi:TetR/AcrR family transcriptional repressor of lmrAB and yxaGH operons
VKTRDIMIETARDLVRVDGFGSTSFRDVWEASGTPRGSVYFHFPAGKEELGVEVLRLGRDAFVETILEASAATRTPGRLITKLLQLVGDQLEASEYRDGCPVAAIAIETSVRSPVLREAADEAFAALDQALARELETKGLGSGEARRVAGLVISTMEGAVLISKARADRGPLDEAARLLPKALAA